MRENNLQVLMQMSEARELAKLREEGKKREENYAFKGASRQIRNYMRVIEAFPNNLGDIERDGCNYNFLSHDYYKYSLERPSQYYPSIKNMVSKREIYDEARREFFEDVRKEYYAKFFNFSSSENFSCTNCRNSGVKERFFNARENLIKLVFNKLIADKEQFMEMNSHRDIKKIEEKYDFFDWTFEFMHAEHVLNSIQTKLRDYMRLVEGMQDDLGTPEVNERDYYSNSLNSLSKSSLESYLESCNGSFGTESIVQEIINRKEDYDSARCLLLESLRQDNCSCSKKRRIFYAARENLKNLIFKGES